MPEPLDFSVLPPPQPAPAPVAPPLDFSVLPPVTAQAAQAFGRVPQSFVGQVGEAFSDIPTVARNAAAFPYVFANSAMGNPGPAEALANDAAATRNARGVANYGTEPTGAGVVAGGAIRALPLIAASALAPETIPENVVEAVGTTLAPVAIRAAQAVPGAVAFGGASGTDRLAAGGTPGQAAASAGLGALTSLVPGVKTGGGAVADLAAQTAAMTAVGAGQGVGENVISGEDPLKGIAAEAPTNAAIGFLMAALHLTYERAAAAYARQTPEMQAKIAAQAAKVAAPQPEKPPGLVNGNPSEIPNSSPAGSVRASVGQDSGMPGAVDPMAAKRAAAEAQLSAQMDSADRGASVQPSFPEASVKEAQPEPPPAPGKDVPLGQDQIKTQADEAQKEGLLNPAPNQIVEPNKMVGADAGPVASFRTERGNSLYTIGENGSTQRDKGASGGIHAGDVGPKEPSQQTVYVEPHAAALLDRIYAQGETPAKMALQDGKLRLTEAQYARESTPSAPGLPGKVTGRLPDRVTEVPYPEIGLHPVEFMPNSQHIGSKITEVTRAENTPSAAPADTRPVPAAGVATPPEKLPLRGEKTHEQPVDPGASTEPAATTPAAAAIEDTRGKGVQYHGARGPVSDLREGYYNPANIYGGMDTLYTTDSTHIAGGYKRKKKSGMIYRVDETKPQNLFNMESPKTEGEWQQFLGERASRGFMGDALSSAIQEHGRDVNLREIMDEARNISRDSNMTREDVQEEFSGIQEKLEADKYTGLTHVGGLKTGKAEYAPPSLGKTVNEVMDNWAKAKAGPGQVVVGQIMPGHTYFLRDGKMYRELPATKTQKFPSYREADHHEQSAVEDAIGKGQFEIRRQPQKGIVGGQGGHGTIAEAEAPTTRIHQATGMPLESNEVRGLPAPGTRGKPSPKPVPLPSTPPKAAPAPRPKENLASSLLWGERSLVKNDVVPTARDAAKGLHEAAADIRSTMAPQTAGKDAAIEAGILREHGGTLAQRTDRAVDALHTASKFFRSRDDAQNLDFINRVETGQKQETPELQAIANTMRDMLDGRRKEVHDLGTGKLEQFIEDYFPHVWADPEKAAQAFSQANAKKPLEGPKSFLKKRSIPTMAEGIALGLEPLSKNPVDSVLLKVNEMDKYILGQRVIQEMKDRGSAVFVKATEKPPDGLVRLNDKSAQVYGPPTISVTEHVDKAVLDGLNHVLDNLGVKHERMAKLRAGLLGSSEAATNTIRSRAGSELGVVAHELGHQLDDNHGLGKILNQPKYDAELSALADLHGHPGDYFHTPAEKMATVVEAYVQARERMRELAPNVLDRFEQVIASDPRLAPLKDIKPGLEYEPQTSEHAHGGLLKMGEYYASPQVADVFNNYLSSGLRKSAAFRAFLGLGNTINQAQLGFSAYHLGFTSLDASISKFANAAGYLAEGKPVKALTEAAQVSFAPLTNLMLGDKVYKEWTKPGSQGAEIAKIVDGMRMAGGRAKQDLLFQTKAAERMTEAFRQGNILGGMLRIPHAAVDLAARPIMDYIVPRQKMGVFADMARRELAKLPSAATADDVRRVMGRAWDSVDNRMGQMVYDNLFWNRTAKDLAMASTRSVGWNLGTFREIGGGLLDTGKAVANAARLRRPEFTHRMAYVVALPVITGMMGAMMHYLFNGQGPQELKDYFFPKTGAKDPEGNDVRLSMPSYMKDVWAFSHAPGHTLTSKLHPALNMVAEMLNNRDYYNTEIRNPNDPLTKQALDVAGYVGKEMLPFGVRNAQESGKAGQPGWMKAAGFVGLTKAPFWLDQTKAQAKASELAKAKMPQGAMTQEQAAKVQFGRDTVDQLRSSDPDESAKAAQAIQDAVTAGKLTPQQAGNLMKKADMTGLQISVKRLSADEGMQIWRLATPKEKELLWNELDDKIDNSHVSDEQKDAMWKELGDDPSATK